MVVTWEVQSTVIPKKHERLRCKGNTFSDELVTQVMQQLN
jgi:hypothetical protein